MVYIYGIYIYIYIFMYAVIFYYSAILYLAEAIITMPSPRNHILYLFIWMPALSRNGQSAKCNMFTTKTQN